MANASRTVKVPLADLWKAWATPAGRRRWLADPALVVRKATPQKTLRITWVDGESNVEVQFVEKGSGKSLVTVRHSLLRNAREVARMKKYWRRAFDDLQEAVGS